MSAPDAELLALYASARAYLEWEAELSGMGIPHIERRAPRARSEGADVGSAAQVASVQPAARAPVSEPPRTNERPPSSPPVRELPAPSVRPAMSIASEAGEGELVRAALPALAAAAAEPAREPDGDKRVRLAQLSEQVAGCRRCELAKGRTHTVFARGNPDSPVAFIGEGPGQEEDRMGLPFVGPAGQLLDRMIAAMGYGRDDVYICNVVKCRPPGNRTPLPSEAGACAPFLLGQLDLVRPRVIVALGRCATENMGLVGGGPWRGRWGKFRAIDVMPTYHPAFLLRSPEYKRPVWEDLQKVMARLKEQPG